MISKNKKTITIKSNHSDHANHEALIARIGLAMMSMAAVTSLLELQDLRIPKLAPSAQLAPAVVNEQDGNRVEELVRREKEETRHAIVSYGETMRSQPTAGRQ